MAAVLFILPLSNKYFLYLTLFLILIFSGIGLPIPEEVTLILGGYLAYLEFVDFWPAVFVLTSGIVIADLLGYCLGRIYGDWVKRNIFDRFRGASKIFDRVKYHFDRHGERVVFFSRPLLGIRVAVPILAGYFRMNFFRFFFFDALAAIPWTAFLVYLSYYLGSGLDLITEVKEIKHAVYFFVGFAIILYSAIKFIRSDEKSDLVK